MDSKGLIWADANTDRTLFKGQRIVFGVLILGYVSNFDNFFFIYDIPYLSVYLILKAHDYYTSILPSTYKDPNQLKIEYTKKKDL